MSDMDMVEGADVTTPANRVFRALTEKEVAEDAIMDAMLARGVIKDGGWEDMWFDGYDGSVEISGLPAGAELTSEQLAVVWELGFDRIWIHDVNKAERYYWRAAQK